MAAVFAWHSAFLGGAAGSRVPTPAPGARALCGATGAIAQLPAIAHAFIAAAPGRVQLLIPIMCLPCIFPHAPQCMIARPEFELAAAHLKQS